jgi:protocatechuate 3,4-dioxygenase beta subunit
MDNDDAPVGRILSRREIFSLFGAAGAAMVVGVACDSNDSASKATATAAGSGGSPASTAAGGASAAATGAATTAATAAQTVNCVVTPELTEGPYFVDEKLNRADIRTDSKTNAAKAGTPFTLDIGVFQASSSQCLPLANAQVDVWHCDAAGVYSDASDPGFNTKGQNFLRGYQTTDATGRVKFTTIYPGWYQGRAVHIHFKIRFTKDGKAHEFTSQWFFDEAMNDEVFAQQPYAAKGKRTLLNERDGIYQQSKGQTLMAVKKSGDGYAGTFDIGMQVA